ncbi:hypothetical protein [Clostridium cochlearium]|uniref:Uncharacterized protein n=1 Tax=Clostridium cochlearium TaxID=1494 RepID=A0A2X2VYV6_CLOCO|nr:hypothetical protein [Clostridium cochlearium]SQB33594.1 Uncharacterised protein [Clostridium cochlearium]
MFKKIFSFFISACLIISGITFNIVQASEIDSEAELTEKGGIYYDYINNTYVTNLYVVENGVTREITFDEYMDSVKSYSENTENTAKNLNIEFAKDDSSIIAPMGLFIHDVFEKSYETTYNNYDWEKRVTPEVTAQFGDEKITIGESYSFTRTLNVSLAGAKENAIKLTLTGAISHSATNSESFSATQTIPKGYIGSVYFAPRVLEARGTVVSTLWDSDERDPIREVDRITGVVAKYPLKVGKYADGIYYTKIRKI